MAGCSSRSTPGAFSRRLPRSANWMSAMIRRRRWAISMEMAISIWSWDRLMVRYFNQLTPPANSESLPRSMLMWAIIPPRHWAILTATAISNMVVVKGTELFSKLITPAVVFGVPNQIGALDVGNYAAPTLGDLDRRRGPRSGRGEGYGRLFQSINTGGVFGSLTRIGAHDLPYFVRAGVWRFGRRRRPRSARGRGSGFLYAFSSAPQIQVNLGEPIQPISASMMSSLSKDMRARAC